MATTRLYERTVVAGIKVKVDVKKLTALLKASAGRVVEESDKGIILEFPSARAAATYEFEAKKAGAIFDELPTD